MKSPFPGMDPYLEDHWGDVHASIAIYARDQLRVQLPSDLKVRVEEYIAVEDYEPDEIHRYAPDVRIMEHDAVSGGAVSIAEPETENDEEPLIVPFYVEPPTQREIRIFDSKEGGKLITAIEILSPTNKKSGRKDYRRKQKELLAAEVNLVEIDLQRRGAWVLAVPRERVREAYRGPYRMCVIRAADIYKAELYQATYSRRLPRIRIPLRPSDADARLDIQLLIDQAYLNGGYGDINYRQEPVPPFLPEEQAWADKLLREQGRR